MRPKYLYSYRRYTTLVDRYEVVKETESNIWLKSPYSSNEFMISKKTYRRGDQWTTERFYEETPELLEKYEYTVLYALYEKHLGKLQKCRDQKVMEQVITIKIPEVKK